MARHRLFFLLLLGDLRQAAEWPNSVAKKYRKPPYALDERSEGIRWSDLLRAVHAAAPDTPRNSVHGGLHNLLTTNQSILKVARGT
jgi:hypothetical protein